MITIWKINKLEIITLD